MKIPMDYSNIDQAAFIEIFEHSNSAIALLRYLPDIDNFSWVLANQAFYDNNVFVTENISGKLLTDVFVRAKEFGLFDLFKEVTLTGEAKNHVLSYHNPIRGNVYQMFHIFRMADGTIVSMFSDYTAIKNSELSVNQERNQYLSTIQNIYDAIISVDTDNQIQIMNNAACELSGWSTPASKGKILSEVFPLHPLDRSINYPFTPNQEALMLKRNDGSVRYVLKRESPVSIDQTPMGNVIILQDITTEMEHRKKEIYLLYHDPLTGVYNRSYMDYQSLKQSFPKPSVVFLADVNGLRHINNTLGFQIGDKLLKTVSEILTAVLPANTILARTGEDDFTAVLPGKGSRDADEVAHKLHVALKEHNVSVSIGYSVLGEDTENFTEALNQAQDFLNSTKVLDVSSLRNSAIVSLLTTLQVKSHETEEHCQRLRDLSIRIGRKIGLGERDIKSLEILSILHDVGKIIVPERILDKPGKLTDEEWEVMKQHPDHGYEICRSTPELSGVAKLVLSHHERYDGKGYPQGLSGDDIPLLSRIIALADSYDAMTNNRVYRNALSWEEAKQELIKNRGTQFDPTLCDVFLEVLEEDGL